MEEKGHYRKAEWINNIKKELQGHEECPLESLTSTLKKVPS